MTTATNKAKNQDIPHEEVENARQAAKEAYDNFLAAKEHLKVAAMSAGIDLKDNAYEHFEETIDLLSEKKQEMLKSSEAYVKENPVTSAGIAFLSGFVISKILSK